MKTLPGSGKIIATADESRKQLYYELISGGSGLLLALFMWGRPAVSHDLPELIRLHRHSRLLLINTWIPVQHNG